MTRPLDPRLEAVAKALHAHRVARGVSQRELAAELGISCSTVSRIESGAGVPDVPTLLAVVDRLDLAAVFFSNTVDAAQAYVRGWNDLAALIRSGLDRIPTITCEER